MPTNPNCEKEFNYADGISLKEYIESRLAAIEKASSLADVAMNIRLEAMNEFRNAMKDQSAEFITCKEIDLIVDRIHAQIESLQKYQHTMEGKASQSSVNIAYAISAISLIIGIVGLLHSLLG